MKRRISKCFYLTRGAATTVAFPLFDGTAPKGKQAVLRSSVLSYYMTSGGPQVGALFGIATVDKQSFLDAFRTTYWNQVTSAFQIEDALSSYAAVAAANYTPLVNNVDTFATSNNRFEGHWSGAAGRHPYSKFDYFFTHWSSIGIFQLQLGDIPVPPGSSRNLIMPFMTPFQEFSPYNVIDGASYAIGTFSCELDYV
jgi:hypothetical protein